MSSNCWSSITLVSQDGKEIDVPVDVLSAAASPVWRERFTLTGDYTKQCRSEEPYGLHALEAFVTVISHGSQEATPTPVVDLQTLISAMPLIHKYDCK